MKIYVIVLRLIGIVLTLILGWGVLCPVMISAPSDVLVVLGIAMIIIVPVTAYLIFRPLYKGIKKKAEAEAKKYFEWHTPPRKTKTNL
jgi:multisubunit Na+/H+ antiporter MnhG subunit